MSTDDRIYNEACAEVYDQWFGHCEEAAVDRLAELAGSGRVLRLRWSNWDRAEMGPHSERHISVYERRPRG